MKKPVLILLHGFLGSRDDWSALVKHLPNVTCICVDLPGHGAHHPADIPPFENISRWLQQFIEAQRISEYHLLGYSLGGRLAMSFAATNPAGLKSLIIENSHPGLTDDQEKKQRACHDALWAKRFYREPLTDVLADWYQQPVFADLTTDARQQLITLRAQNHATSLAKALCRYSLARQADFRDWIKTTPTPVLYLCGTEDSKFQAIGQSLVTGTKNLQLTLLPGGHNLHRATPDQMANTIRHWLNTHSGH